MISLDKNYLSIAKRFVDAELVLQNVSLKVYPTQILKNILVNVTLAVINNYQLRNDFLVQHIIQPMLSISSLLLLLVMRWTPPAYSYLLVVYTE